MNTFILILVVAIGAAIAVYMILLLIQKLSRDEFIFTTVEAGNITYTVAGQNIKDIWPNVENHRLSNETDMGGRQWIVKDESKKETSDSLTREEAILYARGLTDEAIEKSFFGRRPGKIAKFLWEKYGIRYVSIFPNQVKVFRFNVSRVKLLEEKSGGELQDKHTLKNRVVQSHNTDPVSSLMFLVPRPVYIHEIELGGDNSSINMVILAVFQLVIPTLPVFYYKGDFFRLLDVAIEAAVVDFLSKDTPQIIEDPATGKPKEIIAPITYKSWLSMRKGNGSQLEDHLYTLNASKEYMEKLREHSAIEVLERDSDGSIIKAVDGELYTHLDAIVQRPKSAEELAKAFDGIPTDSDDGHDVDLSHGLIPRFGWALQSVRVVGFDPTDETKDLTKAILSVKTKEELAMAAIRESVGKAVSIRNVAEQEANRYKMLLTSLIEQDVPEQQAAEIVGQQIRTENIRDSKVTTWVEAGNTASVMVPAGSGIGNTDQSKESS